MAKGKIRNVHEISPTFLFEGRCDQGWNKSVEGRMPVPENKKVGLISCTFLNKGFTLLEILIALFVFSILSMILASALRTVINADSGTERNAKMMRELQFVLLLLSRDVEQAVNRPILGPTGREESPFLGTPRTFSLTHGGRADPDTRLLRSALQRTTYTWDEGSLWRLTWKELDQAPTSHPQRRLLLVGVREARFQYLGKEVKWLNNWPSNSGDEGPLPRAVLVQLSMVNGGTINQIYIIPVQTET